jgi:hypothetical protein
MAHAMHSMVGSVGVGGVRVNPFDDLVERIRAEFIEQPGLRLTEEQGCRLWQLDRPTLQHVLSRLTDASFLSLSPDGRYTRRSTL